MKSLFLIAILSFSNVWAEETKCTPDQVQQNVIEFLKEGSHYNEDGQKITMENVKIGRATAYPDFDHPISYIITATMKMEMSSSEGTYINENGMMTFWVDANTCEDTLTVFDELKPVNLGN